MILAAGLQTVRTISVKRMIPLLAIGEIALGLMDALKRGIAGGASSAWEKGGAEALFAWDFVRALKAAGRSSLSERFGTARSISILKSLI